MIALVLFPAVIRAETIALPLRLDFKMLRTFFISRAYTDPGQTAVVIDQHEGCRRIVLSDPRFSAGETGLMFETRIDLVSGYYAGNRCFLPLNWQGYLQMQLVPEIATQDWHLSFTPADSQLLDTDRSRAPLAGFVWRFVREHVHDYIQSIRINLAPPVTELEAFLPTLIPDPSLQSVRRMFESLQPGRVMSGQNGLEIELLAQVEPSIEKRPPEKPERFAPAELDQFFELWESWDTFLVHLITFLASEPLSENDRLLLLETLLETRHQISSDLAAGEVARDFVREQFVAAWEKVSPVFRNHLDDDPGADLLGYLSFFTASQALIALDRIGPTLGIEISRNGLIRLFRLLQRDDSVVLQYRSGVNADLRKTLGLGPGPDFTAPVPSSDRIDLAPPGPPATGKEPEAFRPGSNNNWLAFLRDAWIPSAWALEGTSKPPQERLEPWIVPATNLDPYLASVRKVLDRAAQTTLQKGDLEAPYRDTFSRCVLATAWQESCWRQFVRRKNTLTYLRSYNGTSVGLMQINERVWNALYDRDHLRWDIHYNAAAGSEILSVYLTKYFLKRLPKLKNPPDLSPDAVARLLYAMYNGGPRQFYRFMQRRRNDRYFLSDTLFYEKYLWVKERQWDNLRKCLLGG